MRRYDFSPSRVRYVLGALLAAALTTAAVAHADDQDDQFLALVSAQGIPGASEELMASGRAACDNYGNYTLLAQEYRLREWGLSQDQAYKVISDGIKAYCPEKDGAVRLPENFNH
jgi:Protein of unknown function (DUF732)